MHLVFLHFTSVQHLFLYVETALAARGEEDAFFQALHVFCGK